MKTEYKLLLSGIIAIILLDTLGAIASRQLDFNYTKLSPVSLVIYIIIGFIGTRKIDMKITVLLTAFLGFFDSTIGWKICLFLNADTGMPNTDPSAQLWIVTILFMTAYGALCGFIGGGLARLYKATIDLLNR